LRARVAGAKWTMLAKKLRKTSVMIAEAGPWWKRTKLARSVE
jgi:hypothetical protein